MNIKFIDENLVGQNGLSRYIDPKITWKRDIEEYDTAIYTDKKCFDSNIDPNKNNYAWIIEPPIINGENYLHIVRDHKKFKKIFSYNINIADKIDNFEFVPHGGTWLREEDINIHYKNNNVSFIFSDKQWNAYHRMRFRVYDRFKLSSIIDFFGSGASYPIKHKIQGLKNYMFSIVIENSIENDYFTEKILDCFLTGTIPIYCGTKNIEKYFDKNGIIQFDGDEDLPDILLKLNIELYESKIASIKNNYQIAKQYIHPELIINELL